MSRACIRRLQASSRSSSAPLSQLLRASSIWPRAPSSSAGLDPIIAAGIDQLLLKLKEAFGITIIVVTHELASAFLIADRMVLLDKGRIVANGTPAELQASTQPRVRQFLDRIAEPEISQEIDYLQMLTGEVPRPRQ